MGSLRPSKLRCRLFGHDWTEPEWEDHPVSVVEREQAVLECKRCPVAAIAERTVGEEPPSEDDAEFWLEVGINILDEIADDVEQHADQQSNAQSAGQLRLAMDNIREASDGLEEWLDEWGGDGAE